MHISIRMRTKITNTDLGQNYDLFTRQVELFNSLAKYLLGKTVGVHVCCIERIDAVLITGVRYRTSNQRVHFTEIWSQRYSREFDVLNSLFLFKKPLLPPFVAVLHGTKNDLGHLEARVAQAYCTTS